MTMNKTKKYGGLIVDWYKEEFPEFKDTYGPSLGFVIHGRLDGPDPTGRGFSGYPLRTSMVVEFSPSRIETLNTIYDLGEPRNAK